MAKIFTKLYRLRRRLDEDEEEDPSKREEDFLVSVWAIRFLDQPP